MKGIRLILSALLIPLAFQAAANTYDNDIDTSRAATRRDNAPATVSVRQKHTTTQSTPVKKTSRTTTTNTSNRDVRNRTATVTPRNTTNVNRTVSDTRKPVSARTTVTPTVQSRNQPAKQISTRNATNTSRATINTATPSNRTTTRTRPTTTRARAGALARSATTAPDITTRDFQKCRTVFHDCMDEFCANKDTTLKRCACSSRVNEFDSTKKQLSKIEDKLLDFNQRLLVVNMDKEDATALFTPTEGELAYSDDDRSESKKMLDEIAKKLNTSFNDKNFDQNLNAISMSLNIDAAFDNVDSLMGASTTTKTGTALYNAALPVCREMAAEVCSESDLSIAESGYKMAIEQDCNTVSKSYATQMEQAQTKVKESSALLDMSRLDIHQQRNSDDILTCKSKMLEMLTDTTVCGTDMSKCLDISGQYIDPTTGEAFLTENLANLSTLIKRPDTNQTWTDTPGNEKFVAFLDGKKKFLEPAMENCQDISDYVWKSFIEDALAQIKLAQDRKLDDIRLSCTTLTTQCLSDAYDSISEFDSRALSTFGVMADKTANAMCSEINTACSALIDTIGDSEWSTGMTEIAADKTFETIINTCREVGRQCIIQTCKSTSGNFGLCTDIDTSINRKSIISRRACWDEVQECVASAGEKSINQIMTNIGYSESNSTVLLKKLYGDDIIKYNDNCTDDTPCPNLYAPIECTGCNEKIRILSEYIWGNCEHAPSTEFDTGITHNKIKIVSDQTQETLLSWFARNTNTQNKDDSCRDTTCGAGEEYYSGQDKCVSTDLFEAGTSRRMYCGATAGTTQNFYVFDGIKTLSNCCDTQTLIQDRYCCDSGFSASSTIDNNNSITICVPTEKSQAKYIRTINNQHIICIHEDSEQPLTREDETTLKCDGTLVLMKDGILYQEYDKPHTTKSGYTVSAEYYDGTGTRTYENNDGWSPASTPYRYTIKYTKTTNP